MKLTRKLLGYLNRVFDKSAAPVLALRLRYAGSSMTWKVEDGVLSTQVVGGPGASLTVNLADYTISTLSAYLASRPGYSVPYLNSAGVGSLNARVLLDAEGDQDQSNGDNLMAYTSTLYAWLEPVAAELSDAKASIDIAPLQMAVTTAQGEWLDELGNYYAVPRQPGESDALYSTRMIATIGRPLGNNVAIETALNIVTGGLTARVVDAPAMAFTTPYAGTSYGLFDVIYSIALDGDDDLNTYTSRVRSVVELYRDAGTHMRTLSVSGDLADTYPFATVDDSTITLQVNPTLEDTVSMSGKRHDGTYRRDGSFISNWDGVRSYDGSIYYGWTPGPAVTFGNSGEELFITITNSGVTSPPEGI